MRCGEVANDLLTMIGESDDNLAAVWQHAAPANQAAPHGAIDQLDGTVVLDLEPLSQESYGRLAACRRAFDGQQ